VGHLTRIDFERGLQLVERVAEDSASASRFARSGVEAIATLISSDLTTLSVCNLKTGHRQAVGLPGQGLSRSDIAAFDRHFFDHPLVRHHGFDGGRSSWRISDSLSRREFHRTDLYNEHYRRVGMRHAMAVPIYVARGNLVSFVLNRSSRDFSDRERACADLVRPILSSLYQTACERSRPNAQDDNANATTRSAMRGPAMVPEPAASQILLTTREQEVIRWVSFGKTDRDIAVLLGISVRTVQKHLENSFVKLGVETRTAAAMRLMYPDHPVR
jgi:DNA-binding CsgD family transcriptional regulator